MIDIFKNLFKRKKPEFNTLNAFSFKDKYFYRVATWTWHSESEITVFDPHGPRVITLDAWPQLIFIDAKGKMTVSEYVEYMASNYRYNIPNNLDKQIIFELETLLNEKLIDFSDTEVTLDSSIENPKNFK